MTLPTPRRQTAQQFALEHLRSQIASGTLQPDDRIRQEQLADEIGSSVVPVREALKTLEAEGQVRYIPHRGYHVARLSLEELIETYQLRRLLEDEAVRVGIEQLTEDDFSVLDLAIEDMETASSEIDIATMTAANLRFHFTIFDAAAMPRLSHFIRLLWQSTDPYRALYYADDGHRARANDEHRRIVVALHARDTQGAIAELDRHREHAIEGLTGLLGIRES